jgi:hypothetical protein
MTQLANELLTTSLRHTQGWSIAAAQMSAPVQGNTPQAGAQH